MRVCGCESARKRGRERRLFASLKRSRRALLRYIVWWSPRFPLNLHSGLSGWGRSNKAAERTFSAGGVELDFFAGQLSCVRRTGPRGHAAPLWITLTPAVRQGASRIRVPQRTANCCHEWFSQSASVTLGWLPFLGFLVIIGFLRGIK